MRGEPGGELHDRPARPLDASVAFAGVQPDTQRKAARARPPDQWLGAADGAHRAVERGQDRRVADRHPLPAQAGDRARPFARIRQRCGQHGAEHAVRLGRLAHRGDERLQQREARRGLPEELEVVIPGQFDEPGRRANGD